MEKSFHFRYDRHIGKTVEALVNTLPGHERRVLRARYVTWSHLADELVAPLWPARPQPGPAAGRASALRPMLATVATGCCMSNADKPLPAKVCDVLAVTPKPLFLGEIEAALEFAYDKAEIMSVL